MEAGNTDCLVINTSREPTDPPVYIDTHISRAMSGYEHQIDGVRFIWNALMEPYRTDGVESSGTGAIIAHDMGLGKTFQVFSYILGIRPCASCVCIVLTD